MSSSQDQSNEAGGLAIQAGRDVVVTNHGVTYAEAKDIALTVFRANFESLAGAAREVAQHRAEEITENFLARLQRENPAGLSMANNPDFQLALCTAQREYARTGDKDLATLLVDLLVDRSKQESRNLMQIVLGESISVASKLTSIDIAILSAVFYLRYSRVTDITSLERLMRVFDRNVQPLCAVLPISASHYQHLQYSACASIEVTQSELESLLSTAYSGLFQRGFPPTQIDNGYNLSAEARDSLFRASSRDSSKIEFSTLNLETLSAQLDLLGFSVDKKMEMTMLYKNGAIMSSPEIKAACVNARPYLGRIFEVWSTSNLRHMQLTSVGIAIGHANIRRLDGSFSDLSIWIHE